MIGWVGTGECWWFMGRGLPGALGARMASGGAGVVYFLISLVG